METKPHKLFDEDDKKSLLYYAFELEQKAAAIKAVVNGQPIEFGSNHEGWFDEDEPRFYMLTNPYCMYRPKVIKDKHL